MIYDLKNPLQRANFTTRANALFASQKVVELTEKKPVRTIQQNKYLHVIIGYFASQYGCTIEYAKQNYFKILCNKNIFVRETDDKYLGKVTVARSSASLDTAEMTTAIERFRNWASAEAGIYLPEPNESEMLTYAQQELERYKQYL